MNPRSQVQVLYNAVSLHANEHYIHAFRQLGHGKDVTRVNFFICRLIALPRTKNPVITCEQKMVLQLSQVYER